MPDSLSNTLRIFLAIAPSVSWGVKNNQIWLKNLYEPLLDLGHEVYLFRNDLVGNKIKAPMGSPGFQSAFSQELLETFREQNKRPFDLFFAYFLDYHIDPLCIDEIKKSGVLTCNFSCNNTHQFYLTEKIASHFDYNLHAEKDAEEKFKAIGANTVWFPMAANPRYYHPIKELKREIDVLFIGVNYAKRAYYIWHLLENGIDVHVYGPEWRRDDSGVLRKLRKKAGRIKLLIKYIFLTSPSESLELSSRIAERDFRDRLFWKYRDHMHPPPISDDEMIRKYSECKISLGFLEVYDRHDPSAIVKQHLHLREFEAPMSGALYFTNYCEELAEFYKLDKEVVVYRNEHELLDKVKYYLSHPNEAEKIRKAGHKRAISCHTYQKRFEELFKTLGI